MHDENPALAQLPDGLGLPMVLRLILRPHPNNVECEGKGIPTLNLPVVSFFPGALHAVQIWSMRKLLRKKQIIPAASSFPLRTSKHFAGRQPPLSLPRW